MYQEDDFRGALIEFSRAYELAPNWAVLYNVGQSHYQLREYATALRTLERYLDEGGDKVAGDRRAEVELELAELRARVAHVTVVANVDDVDVALDDAPLGKASRSEPRLVGEGRHRVTASKPGYTPVSKVVDIAGGDSPTLHFDLTPVAPELPLPPKLPTARPRPAANYAASIVTGAVGVAGLAVGTVFGVLTLNDHAALNGECTAAKVCQPKAQGDIDAYARNGTISGVGLGFGVVSLAVSGFLFFRERATEGPAHAEVLPWIGPGAGGLIGRF
jgi:hypothetical protein